MRTRCWACLSVVLAVSAVRAQEKNDKGAPSVRTDANAVEIRFADDSTVKMTLESASIEVATRYGKLTVPVNEIRRIDFGLRIPDEPAKRTDAVVVQLGN